MKNQFLFLFCLFSGIISAQVSSVDYVMIYNCETNQYDVHIEIIEGSATTIPQRAQFNSQISLVVPTGETITLTDTYMPLQNNQLYDGATPLEWWLGTPKIAPAAQPENDFYGITPTLSPASFYNDLHPGDIVKLFSFTAGDSGQYDENVRFFRNNEDPDSSQPGMGGDSFSNGFTLGGPIQLYHGNIEESCITDVDKILPETTNIYPNPFQNQITIEIPEGTLGISVLDSKGELYYESPNTNDRLLLLNASEFPRGIYFIRVTKRNGSFHSQRALKL